MHVLPCKYSGTRTQVSTQDTALTSVCLQKNDLVNMPFSSFGGDEIDCM